MDLLLAWKVFTDSLPKAKAEKTLLLLKTEAIDNNGTDLPRVIEYFFSDSNGNVNVLDHKLSTEDMGYLYNVADGTALLSSNEGWGLSLLNLYFVVYLYRS